MAVGRPDVPRIVFLGLVAAGVVSQIVWAMIAAGSLTAGLEVLAFFLGSGGMMLMFFRWRRHGDSVAQVLCLVAFGTWAVAVVIGSVGDSGFTPADPSYWVAGLALLIGFGGGVATLLRRYLSRGKRDALPPSSSS